MTFLPADIWIEFRYECGSSALSLQDDLIGSYPVVYSIHAKLQTPVRSERCHSGDLDSEGYMIVTCETYGFGLDGYLQ